MQLNYHTIAQNQKLKAEKKLKKAIWLYFWLLIFEGALRKWVVPSLASPLLVVRDPVAVWILFVALKNDILKRNGYITAMIIITAISFIATLTVGHQNIYVAFFGARIFLIHFPLIFVIAKVFNQDDVVKIGKVFVWLTPPMTVLIAIQFYSPQTAWVNRGVGGDETGGGFSGALGYFRPPATFSFITGTTLFFSMAGAYILYFWFNKSNIKIWLLVLASIGWAASIPFCISRTLFFQTVITLLFLLPMLANNSKNFSRVLVGVVGFSIVLSILSTIPFFQNATDAFLTRYDSANTAEGGVQGVLLDRFLGVC